VNWKNSWLIFAVIIATLVSCKREEVQGRVYISDPRQGGIARAQVGELIPYSKTAGFYCISPEDLELFMVEWEAAQNADKQ
jgi:hypothetical protein